MTPVTPEHGTLLEAARDGDAVRVQELLGSGADPNAVGDEGRSVLIEAVTNLWVESRLSIVRALLAAGADADSRDDVGRSALIHSVISGSVEVALALRAEGADLESLDNFGLSPLTCAAACGHAWMVDWLIACGVTVDGGGAFPAQLAAAYAGHVRIVRLLIKAGADPYVSDRDLNTMLTFAGRRGDTELVRLLLEAKPAHLGTRELGFTRLMAAAALGQVEEARRLVQKGANIRERDPAGNTALKYALDAGRIEVVLLLLAAETCDEERSRNLRTAFREVLTWGDSLAIEMLREQVSMDRGVDLSIVTSAENEIRRQCSLCGIQLVQEAGWVQGHFLEEHTLELSRGEAHRLLSEPKTKDVSLRDPRPGTGRSSVSGGLPGQGKRQ